MVNQENKKIGINNTSSEWFKPKIDRKILKELSKRNDLEGWKHIIIFFTSLILLGLLSTRDSRSMINQVLWYLCRTCL